MNPTRCLFFSAVLFGTLQFPTGCYDLALPSRDARGGAAGAGDAGRTWVPGGSAGAKGWAGEAGRGGSAGSGDAPAVCTSAVDCANPACAGEPCGDHGQICSLEGCICPGHMETETRCDDGVDNDCDGDTDCADPDCESARCGAAAGARCCGGSCIDTTSDDSHCQGCGLACAPGQHCEPITDAEGIRGHCTCLGTSECPNAPAQICRANNDDGQDGLCACDGELHGNLGCATGQLCIAVARANFCAY